MVDRSDSAPHAALDTHATLAGTPEGLVSGETMDAGSALEPPATEPEVPGVESADGTDPRWAAATPVPLEAALNDSASDATYPEASKSESLVGRHLGRGKYTVIELLGRGGLGTVYRAVQHPVERPVAIKVINRNRADDPVLRKRFQREAAAAAHLKHPAVVALYDFGDEDGELYMVMELVDGEELRSRIHRDRRLAPELAVNLARQICAGLTHAHELGFVHRDLKPENIMISVGSDGEHRARILDFGIVKAIRSDALSAHNTGHETRAGVIMGTPAYLAPEQAYARDITAATDQYSLGVVLYEMLTGRLPYSRGSEFEIMTAHCVAPFPPMPLEANVPAALEAVVERAMAKKPEDRFPSVKAMSAALLAGLKPPVGRGDRTQPRVPAPRMHTDEQRGLVVEGGPSTSAVVASVPNPINTRASGDATPRRADLTPDLGAPAGEAPPRRLAWMLAAGLVFGGAGVFALIGTGDPAKQPPATVASANLGKDTDAFAAVAVVRADAAAPVRDAAVPGAAVPDAAVPDAAIPDASPPDAARLAARRRVREVGGNRPRRTRGVASSPPKPHPPAAAERNDCAADFARIKQEAKGSSLAKGTPLCRRLLDLGRRQRAGKCEHTVGGLDDVVALCE